MQKSEFEFELEILGLTSFVTSRKGMNDYYGDEENYVNDSNDQNYVIIDDVHGETMLVMQTMLMKKNITMKIMLKIKKKIALKIL